MGLFLAATLVGATMLVGIENVMASTRDNGPPDDFPAVGDPNQNSARDFSPGIKKGFDPQPEPPGRDNSAGDLAPGHSEIGDPNAVAPGNLKRIIK